MPCGAARARAPDRPSLIDLPSTVTAWWFVFTQPPRPTTVAATLRSTRERFALPDPIREAVARVIARQRLEPRIVGRPLLGRLRPQWSERVGNYRILYTFEARPDHEQVVVRAIRHRGVAYGRRRRRR